jgi:hypothetical protein
MELVVAQVQRGVDWLERLKVNVDLLFLSLVRDYRSTALLAVVFLNVFAF